mgnify:CR=1 FL=1
MKIAEKLPGLDLHCEYAIANPLQSYDTSAAIQHCVADVARSLSRTIAENSKFFDIKENGHLITVRGDAYVLTKQELRSELMKYFELGIEYAKSFPIRMTVQP